jgi:hypothetical protein
MSVTKGKTLLFSKITEPMSVRNTLTDIGSFILGKIAVLRELTDIESVKWDKMLRKRLV